jgi:hypothetical protein
MRRIVLLCERARATPDGGSCLALNSCFLALFLSLVDRLGCLRVGQVFLLMLNLLGWARIRNGLVEFAVCRFGYLVFGLLRPLITSTNSQ